jgi:hypothetical protein
VTLNSRFHQKILDMQKISKQYFSLKEKKLGKKLKHLLKYSFWNILVVELEF